MKIQVAFGTILVVIVVGALLLLSDGSPPPEGRIADAHTSVPEPQRTQSGAFRERGKARAEIETARFQPGSMPPQALGFATITGRCVHAESGQPLPGIDIAVRAKPLDGMPREIFEFWHGPVVWAAPAKVVSKADGRFEVRFAVSPWLPVRVDWSGEGLASACAQWTGLEPGLQRDVGDIPLHEGVLVRGRVRDKDGVPLPGLEFQASGGSPAGSRDPGDPHEFDAHSVTTDAEGRFEFQHPFSPGGWSFFVGLRRLEPRMPLLIEGGEGQLDLDLVYRAMDQTSHVFEGLENEIRGQLVDSSGAAISGAVIAVQGNPLVLCVCDGMGSFRLQRSRQMGRDPVRLESHAYGFETALSEPDLAWGTHDVRIIAQRSPSLAIRVRNAQTGAPIEAYQVWLLVAEGDDDWGVGDRRRLTQGHFEEGVCKLPLHWKRFSICLRPRDSRFAWSPPISIEGPFERADHDLLVELQPSEERIVRVVTKDGSAVVGSRIELIKRRVPGSTVTVRTRVHEPSVLSQRGIESSDALLMQTAATNDAGEVRLEGNPKESYALRVTAKGRVSLVVPEFYPRSLLGPLVVELPAPGTVFCRVQLPQLGADDHAERNLQVHLRGTRQGGASREVIPGEGPLALPPSGNIAIAGVPAGAWWLELREGGRVLQVGETFALVEGGTQRLTLDARSLLELRVAGRAWLDGGVASGRFLRWFRLHEGDREPARALRSSSIETGQNGQFEVGLTLGRWVAQTWLQGEEDRDPVQSAVVAVEPRSPQEIEVFFRLARSVRVQVFQADGLTPAANVDLRATLTQGSRRWFHWGKTDASGQVLVDRCAQGRYRMDAVVAVAPTLPAEGSAASAAKVIRHTLGEAVISASDQSLVFRLPAPSDR